MPPRYKFTKEEIAAAGLEIVRRDGPGAMTARAVGEALGASPKVIFGSFANMEQLQQQVLARAYALYQQKISAAMESGEYPPYKASGMAYIQFAREEKQLFRLLFMRDRTGEPISEDRDSIRPILDVIRKNTGLSEDDAYAMHLDLWITVHGVAVMAATSYLDWSQEQISRILTDCYLGLKLRFCGKEEEHGSHRNSESE